MWNWIRTELGRKIVSVILGPILSSMFAVINSFLPEAARLTPDQVKGVIDFIMGSIIAVVVAQGYADAKNGSPGRPVPTTVTNKTTGEGGCTDTSTELPPELR